MQGAQLSIKYLDFFTQREKMEMKGPSKSFIAAVLTVAAAFGVFGCGSGDGESTAADPLTKAQFLKAGDLLCRERLEEKDQLLQETLADFSPSEKYKPSEKAVTGLGESILPPIQKLADELAALEGPPSDEAAIEKLERDLAAGLKRSEADPSILLQTNPFSKASESARAYGFQACNL
jgi:hypothetical protein